VDSPITGTSLSSVWAERLSAITSFPLFSNPTIIAIVLMATLIPVALFREGIGKNSTAKVSPSMEAKGAANDAAREVKSKKNK